MKTVSGRPLRVAMIGQKGLPATYGGIERHVEEIGARLASRGHEVTVFCRPRYVPERQRSYQGIRLRYVPTIDNMYLEAIVHSVLCSAASLGRRYDIIHYHAVGPGLAAPIVKAASSARVVLTVHGLDGDRAKWAGPARRVLRLATWMSARSPDATVVVSEALAAHYRSKYHREVAVVLNGVVAQPPRKASSFLRGLGLAPGSYVLFVGRFVPEKAPDLLVKAFRKVPGDYSLVLAGGSSNTDEYAQLVSSLAASDPRVVLPGYVYGDDLSELYSNAGLFVLPSYLEGLPLTLLEAAAARLPILASAIPAHLEVIGADRPGARLFRQGDQVDLTRTLEHCLADLERERGGATALRADVLARYSWERAVDSLEALYRDLHTY